MNAFAHSRNVDNGIKIEIDKSNVYCPNHEGSVCFTRINGRNCCLLFSSAACQLVNLYKSNLARQDASAFCEMAKKSCLRMILATCQPKNFLGRFSSTCQLVTLYNFNLLIIDANRVAGLGRLSAGAKMAMKPFVKHVFTILATNASFLRVISNFRI